MTNFKTYACKGYKLLVSLAMQVMFVFYLALPTFALFAWKHYLFAGTGYAFLICFVSSVVGSLATAFLSYYFGFKAGKEEATDKAA